MRMLATILALTTIAAAPFPARLTPAGAVRLAAADAARLPADDLPYYRYVWVGGVRGDEWVTFRAAFRYHLNSINRRVLITDVVEVAPDLWRIDASTLGWDLAVLENAAKADPYFHAKVTLGQDSKVITYWPGGIDPAFKKAFKAGSYATQKKKGDVVDAAAPWLDEKAILYLRKALVTEVPVLSAPWLLAQGARQVNANGKQTGLGYYDFLGLKNRDDYFKLIKLRIKDSQELEKEVRAVVKKSGVSALNRQIVRFQALTGGAWFTLDTSNGTGKGNAVRNLDGFEHQAEEHYGFLPSGLPVYFLCDNKGVRQDFAPADNFGFADDSVLNESRDLRIHVNIACVRCHAGDVLKPIKDYIRKRFRGKLKLQTPDKKKQYELQYKYFSDLDGHLTLDRALYTRAIALATTTRNYPKGMTPAEAATAYANAYHNYVDRELTLNDAARELGTTPGQWRAALVKYVKATGQLDLEFATWLDDEPGKLTRVAWEDSYQLAQSILHVPLEKAKVKAK